ncbi:AIPR family protein [Acinetobacter sp. CWB-G5]|uniref:AIPR family protein n=1 Tax=Acinetobacter sp. CWB-G5 TaxID=2855444 RepID=UPI001C488AD4|nr:AIPR family protein [Acinetobacter sp. CWB-G5]MBV7307300.1 AIPR family protein [Acinetobacter sp. CWB-G5]
MTTNAHVILQQILDDQITELGIDTDANTFFGTFSALQILKNNELTYDEITSGNVDGSLDGGIDNFYLFINGDLIDWRCFITQEEESELEDTENENLLTVKNIKEKYKKNIEIEVVIIQSKLTNSFAETPITTLKSSLANLLDFEADFSQFSHRYKADVLNSFHVFQQIYLALVSRRGNVKINIYYTSKGSDVHDNVRAQSEELKTLIKTKIANSTVNFNFYGAQKLTELYQKVADTDFDLNLVENCISNNTSSYIGLTNIVELYKFITDTDDKLIKHIFESNVRDYQGKNNVNSEIENTLLHDSGEDFWWLNNGITILSSNVTQKTNKLLSIQNPEIVNGLQTSSVINLFFKNHPHRKEAESRNVLIRVIVPTSEEVRDKIIKATNSQTQIPKASLRATDPIHRQIESFLKPKGLFYDRRKNFYKNEGKKPKEIVSISFMSQCLISVLMQRPDYARARPSTLLDDDDSYNRLYSENTPLEVYYLISYFGKKVEEHTRNIPNLESNQSTDIKFHVLYASIALACKSTRPTNQAIRLLNESSIDEYLPDAIGITSSLYLGNGGNNKAAKAQKMREELISRLHFVLNTKGLFG